MNRKSIWNFGNRLKLWLLRDALTAPIAGKIGDSRTGQKAQNLLDITGNTSDNYFETKWNSLFSIEGWHAKEIAPSK
jgi:hypothetical protein